MIYEKVAKCFYSYQGKKCVIGQSAGGRNLYAFHVGDEKDNQFLSVYAVHGREWITACLGLKHIALGVKRGGGWIVPLVNPDGAHISETQNPLWKANGRGVDINCNFDAAWGTGVENTTQRGAESCIGDYPFSEAESSSLRDFTLFVQPKVTLSWHTKGEEIYWEFMGLGDRRGADILANATGYKVKQITGSSGGYKDWCLQKCGIAAYTIECGANHLNHPILKLSELAPCFDALSYFTENYF